MDEIAIVKKQVQKAEWTEKIRRTRPHRIKIYAKACGYAK